jgi:hypothetical protein
VNKRIAILQVDGENYHGTRFPNMALMQIAAYHEASGDSVHWYEGGLFAEQYDEIYGSKIFSFSPMPDLPARAHIGGTGIDFFNKLPADIAAFAPSYSLYPDLEYHAGFSMKGCRFGCKFCCVPKKEGRPWSNSSIDDLLRNPRGKNRLMLLDNDFFGIPQWRENLQRIIDLKLRVCFVQGLNIRIITQEQADLLARCRYTNSKFNQKYLSFAWDRHFDKDLIFRGIDICNRAGIPCKHMQFFVLIGFDTTHEQNLDRIYSLRDKGCMPFVMPYNKSDPYQKAMTRWVNSRKIFKTTNWENYKYKVNHEK